MIDLAAAGLKLYETTSLPNSIAKNVVELRGPPALRRNGSAKTMKLSIKRNRIAINNTLLILGSSI